MRYLYGEQCYLEMYRYFLTDEKHIHRISLMKTEVGGTFWEGFLNLVLGNSFEIYNLYCQSK